MQYSQSNQMDSTYQFRLQMSTRRAPGMPWYIDYGSR